MPMMSGDNPKEQFYGFRGNPPRGASAAKPNTASPLLGKPSVAGPPTANINATPSKNAPSRSAPTMAKAASHARTIAQPSSASAKRGTSMSSPPKTPQFTGGPQPARTPVAGGTGRGKPSASSSFGKANRPAGRPGKIGMPSFKGRGR